MDAAASASNVLPLPTNTAARTEPSTVKLTSAAPIQIPGQMRPPNMRAAARARPDGGHTAVA